MARSAKLERWLEASADPNLYYCTCVLPSEDSSGDGSAVPGEGNRLPRASMPVFLRVASEVRTPPAAASQVVAGEEARAGEQQVAKEGAAAQAEIKCSENELVSMATNATNVTAATVRGEPDDWQEGDTSMVKELSMEWAMGQDAYSVTTKIEAVSALNKGHCPQCRHPRDPRRYSKVIKETGMTRAWPLIYPTREQGGLSLRATKLKHRAGRLLGDVSSKLKLAPKKPEERPSSSSPPPPPLPPPSREVIVPADPEPLPGSGSELINSLSSSDEANAARGAMDESLARLRRAHTLLQKSHVAPLAGKS